MYRVSVVIVEYVGVDRIQYVSSQRFAGLDFSVGTRLKVSKRGLPIKTASEFIKVRTTTG